MKNQILDFNQVIQYSFPTKIFFGNKSRNLIPKHLTDRNTKNVLIVTDEIMKTNSLLINLIADLENQKIKTNIFSEIKGNPTQIHVLKGVEVYKKNNPDTILAIGGGSVIDVAKAILLMGTHEGEIFDYEDGLPTAPPIIEKNLAHFIAIPTTAGTGSEVGRSTVISDSKTHVKKIIFSPALLAKAVYADPEFILNLPASITASTGMDALTHCIESYLANGFHPICDGIALEGISLASVSLEKCYNFAQKNSDNENINEQLFYRGLMLNVSMMGAIAFQKGLGVNHSCAHALSTVCDMHHGLANGIMLPYTMEFNSEIEKSKFEKMDSIVKLNNNNLNKNNLNFSANDFINWIISLKNNLSIPHKLSEAGVIKENIKDLVKFATQDSCHLSNPRKVTENDFLNIFNQAY